MLLKILKMILYFFVIFAKPVYADNFDSTVDTSSNQYFQTIAFTTLGYPSIKDILYQKADFVAEGTASTLSNNIGGFTDFDYTRRIPMVADYVNVPPGTLIDVVYLYKNSTGHSVDISKVVWVLSRNNKTNGDLTELLNVSGYSEGNLNYKYSGQNLTKSGIYKEYTGKGMIPNGGSGAYILESVTVKNPLNIDSVKAVANTEGGVDFEIYVQNNSNEYLNNLKLTYSGHEETFNLGAGEEHLVTFSTLSVPSVLGTFSIYNPNIKQVCAVYGSPYYTYNLTDAIPVLSYRGTNVVPGAMVQPIRDSFCIKRIPYTMISEPMVLSVVEEKPETVEEVLGITDNLIESNNENILPKTGSMDWTLVGLLVVDGLLWYSVYILRRNHESKNTNSGICTKSK